MTSTATVAAKKKIRSPESPESVYRFEMEVEDKRRGGWMELEKGGHHRCPGLVESESPIPRPFPVPALSLSRCASPHALVALRCPSHPSLSVIARTRLLDPMFSVSRLCADDVLARSSHCRGRCIGRAIWDEPPVGTDKCLSALLPGTSSSLFSRLLTRFDGAGMGFVAPSARPGNQTPPPSPISGTEGKRSCGRGRGGIPDM